MKKNDMQFLKSVKCIGNLCDLDLECGVRISKMCLIVFDGLIPSVETISTAIAVPVSTLEPLFSFNSTYNFTVIAAA